MSEIQGAADTAPVSFAAQLPAALADLPALETHGQLVVFVSQLRYVESIQALKADGYQLCADLCAVDYLTNADRALPLGVTPERFEVVVNLSSVTDGRTVRVRVQVPADDAHCPTLFYVYPGTESMEREAYDMFGVVFDDHPDLTRILMPEDWEGHPLRKDYGIGRVPVQFKDAPGPR